LVACIVRPLTIYLSLLRNSNRALGEYRLVEVVNDAKDMEEHSENFEIFGAALGTEIIKKSEDENPKKQRKRNAMGRKIGQPAKENTTKPEYAPVYPEAEMTDDMTDFIDVLVFCPRVNEVHETLSIFYSTSPRRSSHPSPMISKHLAT
jgi:hypothetical protein